MAKNDAPDVIVFAKKDGRVRIKLFANDARFLDGSELFVRAKAPDDFLGFYDWLRSCDGAVIGVCLHPDGDTPFPAAIDFLKLLDTRSNADNIYLFFGDNHDFFPNISDDADCCGNLLYHGSDGSIALTFYAPRARAPRHA
ncbi:MAG: hypothetical protein V4754_14195 [Pseudomonadota bacterium]